MVVKRESEVEGGESIKQETVLTKAEAMVEDESKQPPADTTDIPLSVHVADDGSVVVTPAPATHSLFDALCLQYGHVTVDEQRYTVRVRGPHRGSGPHELRGERRRLAAGAACAIECCAVAADERADTGAMAA